MRLSVINSYIFALAIVPCIGGLDAIGCPAAVIWIVPFMAVYSIEGHALRPLTHICDEILITPPSPANLDAFGAVAMPASRPSIVAALKHGSPCAVGWYALMGVLMLYNWPFTHAGNIATFLRPCIILV